MVYRLILCCLILISSNSYAMKEAKPMAVDRRLGVITYSPFDVHKYIGYYGYQTSIIFAEDEAIETISMGDSSPWQMVPSGNRLFLKPVDQDATTNMTLMTNKRIYYFELHAKDAADINAEGLYFAIKFLYPDDTDYITNSGGSSTLASSMPDLTNKSKYNFEYTISGDELISPIKIFDDNQFTYFEFKDKNSELPAFFHVDSSAHESLVNYRIVGNYLVVEAVGERFSLRYNKQIVCVYNEKLIAARKLISQNNGTKNTFNSGDQSNKTY